MATLLRRYFIKPGHWEEFLSMWHPITLIRQRFGFTIEFAFDSVDATSNAFPGWFVDDLSIRPIRPAVPAPQGAPNPT